MPKLLAVLASIATAGCSVFVKDPVGTPPAQCSSFAPVVDTTLAVTFGALAVYSFAAAESQRDSDYEYEAGADAAAGIGAVLLLPTLIAGIAAAQGFGNTRRCRAGVTALRPS
jgi:hypothetical protein